jgi:hypothetical protein
MVVTEQAEAKTQSGRKKLYISQEKNGYSTEQDL